MNNRIDKERIHLLRSSISSPSVLPRFYQISPRTFSTFFAVLRKQPNRGTKEHAA